MSRLQSR